MFSRITGAIVERGEATVLLDVAGLAYDILLPACVAEKLPTQLGERVTLEIYPTFTLEGNCGKFTFFGFTNAIEREFFEALVSVASIGPKTAARAFAQPMGRIARAIDAGDHAFLIKLPGIGNRRRATSSRNYKAKSRSSCSFAMPTFGPNPQLRASPMKRCSCCCNSNISAVKPKR